MTNNNIEFSNPSVQICTDVNHPPIMVVQRDNKFGKIPVLLFPERIYIPKWITRTEIEKSILKVFKSFLKNFYNFDNVSCIIGFDDDKLTHYLIIHTSNTGKNSKK